MKEFIKIAGVNNENPTFIALDGIVKVDGRSSDGSIKIDLVNGNSLILPPGKGADEFLAKFTEGKIIIKDPVPAEGQERTPLAVYIIHPNTGELLTVAAWKELCGESGLNPAEAVEVAVRFPDGHIAAIDKRNLQERTQEEHIKFLKEEGSGRRLGRRDEWIYIYDARFLPEGGTLDEALELIGGDPITRVYWTEERDADVQSGSSFAWFFYGAGGFLNFGNGRLHAYYGRGFRAL